MRIGPNIESQIRLAPTEARSACELAICCAGDSEVAGERILPDGGGDLRGRRPAPRSRWRVRQSGGSENRIAQRGE